MLDVETIISLATVIFSFLGVVLPALWTFRRQEKIDRVEKRESESEIQDRIANAALSLVEPYQKALDDLDARYLECLEAKRELEAKE